MPFVNLPYGIKLVAEYNKDGQVCLNIFWCTKNTPAAVILSDLTNAANAVQTWWNAARVSLTSQMSLTSIKAIDWSVPDGGEYEIGSPSNAAGAVTTSSPLPNNCAIAITQLTAKRGRSQRGRTYLAGVCTGSLNTQNTLNAAPLNVYINSFGAFRTALSASGLTQVVASFVTLGAPRANGQGTAVIGNSADNILDSQRRRLPGRGT